MSNELKALPKAMKVSTIEQEFTDAFRAVQALAHANAHEKGFWDNPGEPSRQLMLMVDEISEAHTYLRKNKGQPSDHIPAFLGIEEELADVVIRIMDMAEYYNLRIAQALVEKMAFNKSRERMHGKKF